MFHEISTNVGLLCCFCHGVMIMNRFLIEMKGTARSDQTYEIILLPFLSTLSLFKVMNRMKYDDSSIYIMKHEKRIYHPMIYPIDHLDYFTDSFRALAALNAGTFVAGIWIVSFVAGLIP